jgi:amidophosphoribosyltransferase
LGVISAFDEQPIYLNSKFGPFCIVTNGLIENKEKLAQDLLKKGISFSEFSLKAVNATELVAKLISQQDSLIKGIEKMFELIEGSCSLLLLNKEGIYAARDRFGYTPLVIGKKKDSWAVTSETSAFTNLDFETVKYLEPGEIVLITDKGIEGKISGKGNQNTGQN